MPWNVTGNGPPSGSTRQRVLDGLEVPAQQDGVRQVRVVPTMRVGGQRRHAVRLQPGPEGTHRVLALVVQQQADRQRHLPRVAAPAGAGTPASLSGCAGGSRHAGQADPCPAPPG